MIETQSHKAGRVLLALVLGVVLAFGLLPAHGALAAANPVEADSTGSIIIESGLAVGDTVNAYRVVEASYDEASNTVAYALADGLSYNGKTGAEGASELMALEDASAMKAAAESLAAQVAGSDSTACVTAAGASAEIPGLAMGQYLVLVTPAAGSADKVYQVTTANLVPTTENGTYKLDDVAIDEVKSQPIEVTKVIGGADSTATSTSAYQNGDAIPFTVKATVPQYPAAADNAINRTFVLGDVMSSGLAFSQDQLDALVVMSPDGAEVLARGDDGAYTATKTAQGFELAFDYDKVARYAGQKLLVRYEATLATESLDGVERNTVTETYNRNPYDPATYTVDSTAEDHSFGFFLLKRGADGATLANASFEVRDAAGALLATITTDAAGYASLSGLKDTGVYTLHESVVPAGYQTVADFTVTIDAANARLDNPATADATESCFQDAGVVTDSLIGSLPATGDTGTLGLGIAGAALIAGAFVLALRARAGKSK